MRRRPLPRSVAGARVREQSTQTLREMRQQAVGFLNATVAELRPVYSEGLPEREGQIFRKNPSRLTIPLAIMAAKWGVRLDLVPGEFWQSEPTAEGYPAVVVSCPCGESPLVEALAPLRICPCERAFLFDGKELWVFNSPKGREATPLAEGEQLPAD